MGSPIGRHGAGRVLWHHLSTCDTANLWECNWNTREQERRRTIHQRMPRAVLPKLFFFVARCTLYLEYNDNLKSGQVNKCVAILRIISF